jgi:SEC-C motif-containing protein
MRFRYTAFTMGKRAHIERTHAPETRTLGNGSSFEPGIEWLKLEILGNVDGGEAADTGIVEFAAYYRLNGRTGVHRERSNFRREDGLWLYVDGTGSSSEAKTKVGRNVPCPCGSGLKFKKCCGK